MDTTLSLDEARLFAAALTALLADAAAGDERWGRAMARAIANLVGANNAVLVLQHGSVVRAFGDGIADEMLHRFALAPAAPPPPADAPPLRTRAWCRLATAWASRTPSDDVVPDQDYSAVGLTANLQLPGGAYASVACHFATPRPAAEARRLMDLLSLLLPTFVRASASRVRAASERASVRELLEGMSTATLLCAPDGTVIHANAALTNALDAEPDREHLRAALTRAATEFARRAGTQSDGGSGFEETHELHTHTGSYRVRCCLLPTADGPIHGSVAVALARVHSGHGPAELRVRFGLTTREAEVAQLLVAGKSNAEVSRALGISPFTARRHTERVLDKLGARSRAQVPALLGAALRTPLPGAAAPAD